MVTSPPDSPDVAVVGGGPVGLLAALLSVRAGLSCVLLERNAAPRGHTRAIGIHPPALEILARAGVAEAFLSCGVRIHEGMAFASPEQTLGRLDFASLDTPYPFVLTLPQPDTETILEQALVAAAPGTVWRGWEVRSVKPAMPKAGGRWTLPEIQTHHPTKGSHTLAPRFILACDGKRSPVRESLGVRMVITPYPHRYLMGDVPLQQTRGRQMNPERAEIHLPAMGLVESFPLPGELRRWVCAVSPQEEAGGVASLSAILLDRAGVQVDAASITGLSAFGTERGIAAEPGAPGVLLVGDAAHVTSPIGGQGMNLGWMHAVEGVALAQAVVQGSQDPASGVLRFGERIRRRARSVIARAEFNMRLGQPTMLPAFRNARIRLMLGLGVTSRKAARQFSMHDLPPLVWPRPPQTKGPVGIPDPPGSA